MTNPPAMAANPVASATHSPLDLHHDFSAVIFFQMSPWNFWVVCEHGQPFFWNGARIITLAAFDGFEGIEIEGHHPVQIDVRTGGNQVGNVAGGLASALDDYGLHVAGVAGKHFRRNSGDDFLVAAQQLHLTGFDQRIVVVSHVTDRVALVFMGVLPFAFLDVVLCFWKGGYGFTGAEHGVPSAVVEVQVGIDDDIDVAGRNADGTEVVEKLGGLAVELRHLFGEFVADSGFDEDGGATAFFVPDEDGVQAGRYAVALVSSDFFRPHNFGDDAEEGSAIEVVDAVREGGEFEIAEGYALHGNLVRF